MRPLRKFYKALEEIRKVDSEMPTQMAACFIAVALRPGITMKELADEVGLAQSSVSRNVAMLSKQFRPGKPGHDLVEAMEDPAERRRKIVRLSFKGRKVAEAINDVIGEGEVKVMEEA